MFFTPPPRRRFLVGIVQVDQLIPAPLSPYLSSLLSTGASALNLLAGVVGMFVWPLLTKYHSTSDDESLELTSSCKRSVKRERLGSRTCIASLSKDHGSCVQYEFLASRNFQLNSGNKKTMEFFPCTGVPTCIDQLDYSVDIEFGQQTHACTSFGR